jgi:hypothetical protein
MVSTRAEPLTFSLFESQSRRLGLEGRFAGGNRVEKGPRCRIRHCTLQRQKDMINRGVEPLTLAFQISEDISTTL